MSQYLRMTVNSLLLTKSSKQKRLLQQTIYPHQAMIQLNLQTQVTLRIRQEQ